MATAAEAHGFGLMTALGWREEARIVLAVLVLDFVAFIWHRANHLYPALWRFHAVHHSDRIFDVSTAFRFHPGEILPAALVRLLAVAALGIPVLGILAFEMLYAFSNQFEHASVRLSRGVERWIGVVFVTPAMHRKHHSTKATEMNRNFATIFSMWDRLLGTFSPSTSSETIEVGLADSSIDAFSPLSLLRMPFRSRKP